jgi:hypothetical protein
MSDRCYEALLKIFGEDYKKEAKEVMAELEKERTKYFKQNDGPTREGFNARVIDFLRDKRFELIAERKRILHDVQTKQKIVDFIAQPAFEKDPAAALKAYMAAGEARYSSGGNLNPENMATALADRSTTQIISAVKASGLEESARTGAIDHSLALEMQQFKPGGKPGISGVPAVAKLAKELNAINKDIVKTLQMSGSSIREFQGYITRQSHDAAKMLQAGFESWFNEILPKLDLEKSFPTLEGHEIRDSLLETYNKITTGAGQAPSMEWNQGTGTTANAAKTTGRSRDLIFKDGELGKPVPWVEYNQKFGNKTVLESMLSSARAQSKSASMMHFFGTNPDNMYMQIKRNILENLKQSPESLQKFTSAQKDLDIVYKTLRGYSDVPGSSTLAKVSQGVMNFESASKLGASVLTAMPSDLATAAVRLYSRDGTNSFSHGLSLLKDYLSEFASPSEKTKAALDVARTIRDYTGGLTGETASKPGVLSRGMMAFWKYSGMDRHPIIMREIMARKIQSSLAEVADKSFAELGMRERADLQRYGIEAHDWEVLRRSVEDHNDPEFGTKKYMTPEGIQGVADNHIESAMSSAGIPAGDITAKGAIDKYRFGVEVKLMAMIQDHMNAASTTPGVRQKSWLLRGTSGDEGLGIMLRLGTQFKSVPLMALSETKRILLSNPSSRPTSLTDAIFKGQGDIYGLTQRIGLLTVAGYVSMAAKDLAMGKTPADPLDPQTAANAMTRGGALGLYGDFLFGQYTKTSSQVASAIAGPTFGQALEAWDMARSGNPKAGKILNMAINNTPFANVFYTRAALDHFVLNSLKDRADPTTLMRQEFRTMQTPALGGGSQQYLFNRPTDYWRPGQ